jgi:hypothetical protein
MSLGTLYQVVLISSVTHAAGDRVPSFNQKWVKQGQKTGVKDRKDDMGLK